MQPVTRSMGLLRVLEELNPLQDIAELANQFLSLVESLISLEAALLCSRMPEAALQDNSRRHRSGMDFKFIQVPLVQAGSLESIPCLCGSGAAVIYCLASN